MTSATDHITQYIELNPQRPGLDEAWLKDYGVAVWALIGYLHAADGDVARVAAAYDVPQEAVEAAIAYYDQHRALIDTRIAANDAECDSLLHTA
jgi:uncharacterized protein (DUF433 family)